MPILQIASQAGRRSCWPTQHCCAQRCVRRLESCARRWRTERATNERCLRQQTYFTTLWCCCGMRVLSWSRWLANYGGASVSAASMRRHHGIEQFRMELNCARRVLRDESNANGALPSVPKLSCMRGDATATHARPCVRQVLTANMGLRVCVSMISMGTTINQAPHIYQL